jgi:cell division protein FtsQ
MLPDDNIDEALSSLTKLEQRQGVLERDIAAIDLRLLDRITVRLRETASAAPADGAAPEEVPTSSTKVTRAKGKT